MVTVGGNGYNDPGSNPEGGIFHYLNNIEKGINPNILSPAMGE